MKYAIIGILLTLGLSLYIFHLENREPVFEAHFFHLNRGRSIFLRGSAGETILIDGGQNSETIRELSKVIPFYRRRIDIVVVTSAMPKNVGGLSEVLERYEVGKIYEPLLIGTSTALELFEETARRKGIPIEKVSKGHRFATYSMQFEVLFPVLDFKYNKTSTPELVLRVDSASTSMVFLGDVSRTIQRSLLNNLERAYLVEFAHGATKSRVSADLLSKLAPEVIVSTKREETLHYKIR